MTELPRAIGGKYLPVRRIGQGGMGAVFEVIHANTGEHLALKVMLARSMLTPDSAERFKREARAATSVKSEHVVRVTDADVAPELNGAPFLVMELLVGRDFESLATASALSHTGVLELLRPVARALDKAHRQGVIHRDLKPENLFLAEREDAAPIVKILDFGIAKINDDGGYQTGSDQILGTPRYMAPEQAGVGRKEVSPATDRFALGLIAFRMLCGRHYFDDNSMVKLLLNVSRGPISSPSALGSTLGENFDHWFARACAADPNARFETCGAQIEALAAALGLPVSESDNRDSFPHSRSSDVPDASPSIEPAPTVVTASRPGNKALRRGLWVIAALAAVLAAATILVQRDERDARSSSAVPAEPPPSNAVVPAQPIRSSGGLAPSDGLGTPSSPPRLAAASASGKPFRRIPAKSAASAAKKPVDAPPSAKPKAAPPRDTIWGER